MSRLADILMRMDRGASRPEGLGEISGLTVSGASTAGWRRGALLVIVVCMVAASVSVVLLKARPVPSTPARASTPTAAPLPTPAAPPPTAERFAALIEQGYQAAQDGALAEAARLFDKALQLSPRDADTWNSLGVVLIRQGQTGRGIEAFRQALRVNPDDAEGHRNLAIAVDGQGRPGEAAIHYRAYLRLAAPSHPARADVQRRLAELPASRGSGTEGRESSGEPR
jgi:tetratricopeptide (TPR) repeat protein